MREAGQVGNCPFQEKVAQLGQQLVVAFQFEQGQPGKPGVAYQSADVRLIFLERSGVYKSQQQSDTRNQDAGVGR